MHLIAYVKQGWHDIATHVSSVHNVSKFASKWPKTSVISVGLMNKIDGGGL